MATCKLCGNVESNEWYKCIICGADLCDECIIDCDKCQGVYCNDDGDCGDFVFDDESEINYCKNCKTKK